MKVLYCVLFFASALTLPLVSYDSLKNELDFLEFSGEFNETVAESLRENGVVYYQLGLHKNKFTIWHPFEAASGGGEFAPIFLKAGYDLMNAHKLNDEFTFSVILKQADWSGVVNDAICETDDKFECPDVIILGTTQIASRVDNDDVFSLNGYFQQYASETGEIFPDNIMQKFYYDYNYEGNWMGIPLVTDVRYFYYNRTTFDTLGLKYPPPDGDWGSNHRISWNWKAMTDYAVAIKDAGYRSGFSFYSAWDEELKLITMIARDYNQVLIGPDRKCGFNNTESIAMLEQVLIPLYTGEKPAANLDFQLFNSSEVIAWINEDFLRDPLDSVWNCCYSPIKDIDGMTMTKIPEKIYDPVSNPTGELRNNFDKIGQVFMPGKATFLGGSGLMITSQSEHKDISWEYLQKFAQNDYSMAVNNIYSSLPPYTSVIEENQVFESSNYDMIKKSYRYAVPIQYPQTSFPQFGELESRKPFRMLLMEMIFKGLNAEQLLSRACEVVDYALLPKCSQSHMSVVDSGCNAFTMSRTLEYVWTSENECKEGIELLEPISIGCPYIPVLSGLAIGMSTTSACIIFIGVIMMLLMINFRKESAIKKSNLLLSSCVVLGAIITASSVLFMSGDPSERICGIEFFVLGYGISIGLGALYMKMWRLVTVFKKKEFNKNRLTDRYMIAHVGLFILIQTGILIFWYLLQKPQAMIETKRLPPTSISYENTVCGYSGQQISIAPILLNVLLVVNIVYLAIKGRNIPAEYNDGHYIGIIIYTIAFLVLIVLSINSLVEDAKIQYAINAGGILFGSLSTILIYSLPKIVNAYNKEELESSIPSEKDVSINPATMKFDRYKPTVIKSENDQE